MVFKLVFLLVALSYFHFSEVEGKFFFGCGPKKDPCEKVSNFLTYFHSLLGANKHKLVVYWGQNAVYNLKKDKEFWEKDLRHFCMNTRYDTIVLAFMHVFFDARQKGCL